MPTNIPILSTDNIYHFLPSSIFKIPVSKHFTKKRGVPKMY